MKNDYQHRTTLAIVLTLLVLSRNKNT